MGSRNGRKPKSPAFQWYPPDALGDGEFAEMSFEARGVFITLLSYSWLNFGIPADPKRIAALLRATPAEFNRCWPIVSRCFRLKSDDPTRLENPRQERERVSQAENRARRLAASEAANAAKRAQVGTETVTDSAAESETPRFPYPSPVSRLPTPGEEIPADKPPARPRKPATGPHPETIQHWEAEWLRTGRASKYAVKAKDGDAVAWMLKQAEPPEVRRRITAMLESRDEFTVKHASLKLLESQWNDYSPRVGVGAPSGNGNVGGRGDAMNSDQTKTWLEEQKALKAKVDAERRGGKVQTLSDLLPRQGLTP